MRRWMRDHDGAELCEMYTMRVRVLLAVCGDIWGYHRHDKDLICREDCESHQLEAVLALVLVDTQFELPYI